MEGDLFKFLKEKPEREGKAPRLLFLINLLVSFNFIICLFLRISLHYQSFCYIYMILYPYHYFLLNLIYKTERAEKEPRLPLPN